MNSLNRIYRLVWSVRSASWVAVAETARGCSKRSGRRGALLDAAVLLAASVGTMLALPALAELPTGATVRAGTLSSTLSGAAMVLTQSTPKAIIDWTSFSIGRGNTVQFIQPDSNAIALNRVTGTAPSAIDGGLRANGQVWLLNPNGLLIGAGGQINSAGFLGSTRALSDADFIAGRYQFSDAAKPGRAVVNQGTISAVNGGYVALAGEQVRNEGLVQADFGTVVLAGAKTFVIDVVGDKLLSFAVTGAVDKSPADGMALVDNLGSIRADGGRVLITARSAAQVIDSVVNTAGLVQADSVSLANGSLVLGSVTLDGGGSGRVSVDGQISANAASGTAGAIRISGEAISLSDSARLAATSPGGGGEILIGGPGTGAASGAKRVGVAAGAAIDASAIDSGASADSAAGGGKVSLLASESIAMSGSIKADAAPQSQGRGGEVRVIADLANPNSRTVLSGTISAQAGRAGGNGGFVETSGSVVQIEDLARVNTAAPSGQAGNWLIDPPDLTIQSGEGAPSASFIGAATLANNLANSNITLTTSATTGQQTQSEAGSPPGNINVNAAVSWASANKLTLSAYANININADISASTGSLALNHGQGAVAAGNTSDYFLKYGVKVNLPAGSNFSTKRGSDGADTVYTVITSLGAAGDAATAPSTATLQGLAATANLSGNFVLGGNVDAAATVTWNGSGSPLVYAGFTPIGPFAGNFDGLGHTISNLSINLPSGTNVGLFGQTGSVAVIKNLGLIGGSVVGSSGVGGLVGRNDGIINNSYNTGNVSAGFQQAGGLVGINHGVINSSYATGGVTAGTAGVAGGLVGILLSGAVNFSYSTGTVSSSGDLVGGLAGSNDHAEIRNSYATGAVSGRSFVGGLAGTNYLASIINSYAVGSVTGNGNSVGGLVGYTNGTVSSSYWNTATSNQSTSAGGVGKTTAEMKASASYAGWDLTNKWLMAEGPTYPLLRELMVPLLVTANSTSKTYDGVSYAGGNGVSYSRTPNVNLQGTLYYVGNSQNSINAGLYMITPGGLSQANVDQNSYNIIFVNGALKIIPAALTVTASAASKTYDGTSTAAITVSALTGFVGTETVTASASGIFDSANVGSRSATASYTLADGGNGGLASNYQLANSTGLTASIYQAQITAISGSLTGTVSKVYDGSTVATLAPSNYSLSGFAIGDGATVIKATGSYDSAGAGTGKTVTVSELTNYYQPVGTTNLSNYSLPTSITGNVGTISKAPLTVTASAATKTYGQTATLLPTAFSWSGLQNGETIGGVTQTSAGTAASAAVGPYPIIPSAASGGSFNPANYVVTYVNGALTVAAAQITAISGSLTGTVSKVYDGSTVATLAPDNYSLSGFVDGDGATVTQTIGNYDSAGAGTGKTVTVTLNSNDYLAGVRTNLSNYSLPTSITGYVGTISKAPLTVTASAATKTYNGSAYNGGAGVSYAGFVNNETSAVLGGALTYGGSSQGAVNTGSYDIVPGGLSSSNYTLAYASGALTVAAAPITAISGSLTGTVSKVYDGSTVATLASGNYVLSGFVNGDGATVTKTIGSYDSAGAGTGKTVTVSELTNYYQAGVNTNLSNYSLPTSITGYVGTISKAPLTVTASAATKTYNGSAYSGGNGVGYAGFVNNETSAVLGGALTYGGSSQGAVNAGSYVIAPDGLSSSNYALAYASGTLTVNPAALTITANNASKTYGQTATLSSTAFTASGLQNGETISTVTETSAGTATTAGVAGSPYAITPSAASGGNFNPANYSIAYANGALTVNPAALMISANNASKTYGQAATLSPTAFTASGLQNGETIAGVAETSAGAAATAGVAGSPYAITPSAASGGNFNAANYSIAYANGALTVNPAALTITANNASKTYGQTAALSPTAFSAIGLQNGETISSVTETSAGTATTAGVSGSPYAITPSAASGGSFNAANYSIAYANGALTVNPSALTITANNASKTYGQTATLSPTEFTASGLQNGETIFSVFETSAGAAATAGVAGSPYAITPSAASGGSFNPANYSIAYANGALTVNPAALTISANNANKTYGQTAALSPTAFTAIGLQNGETIAVVVETSAGAAATAGVAGSPYAITPSAASGGSFNPANYSIAYANGALTVSPAALTIIANNASKTYGQAAALSPTAFTASGLQNGETIASVLETSAGATATAGVAGSPYPIMPSAASGGSFNPLNYSIAYANGALTVSPAALTISANNANKTYGQTATLSPTAFTASGLQNGETISGVIETSTGAAATAGVAGSPYAITPSAASGGSFNPVNYSIAYGNGALTVSPAALTIIANNASKTYGQTAMLSPTAFSASGLQNGETIASVAEASAGAAATAGVAGSPYPIMPSAASGGSFNPANYSIAYTGGALTVSPAALTVTANNANKTYGQTVALSPTAFTASGLQNGETISGVIEASAGTAATAGVAGSPYAITPSAASGGNFSPANYNISYGNGALTVSPAALTVTANNASKTYGQTATLSPTAFTASGLQNGETISSVIETSAGTATTADVAGNPYAITPSAASGGGFNPANYSIAYANGALTVRPAALTVTANNASKTYGQTATLSPTAFTASGLQNGETISSVAETSTGAAATAGVAGSPYAITPSAASGGSFNPANYSIAYANGVLTVSPAALTISANNASKTYGQTPTLSPAAFTASGLQNGETIATVLETSAGAAANAGVAGSPYPIMPSAASGGSFNPANYSVAYTSGALTVNPATLTVTASDLSKTFGQTAVLLPTAFDASGLQNSETIGAVVQTSAGTAGTASVAGSPYAITPSAASGGNFNAGNYSIAYANGALTVTPGAVTQVLTQLVVVNPVVQNLAPIVPPPAPPPTPVAAVAAPVAVPAVQTPVAVVDAPAAGLAASPAPQAAVAPAAAAPAVAGDQAVAVPAATPAAQTTAAAPAAAAGGDPAVPATTPSVQADAAPTAAPAAQAAVVDAPAVVATTSPATSPPPSTASAAPVPAATAAAAPPAPAPVVATAFVPAAAGAAAPATATASGRAPAPPAPPPAAAPVVASPAAAATTVVLAAPPSPVAAVKAVTPRDAADSGDKTLAAAAPPPPPTAPAQQKRSTAAAPTVSLGMVNIQAPAPAKLPAASNTEQRFSLSGNRSSW